MDTDEAVELLDDGYELGVYDTPVGVKLGSTSPTGEDYVFTGDELDKMKEFFETYEETAINAYEADTEDEMREVLLDADEDAWRVIGRIDDTGVSVEEARELVNVDD